MANSIAYRGPDDAGEYLSADVQLAAVRLAIIDLKNGSQPAFSCDGNFAVVQNGEIYNQHELRTALRARGHRLRSESDTELLPHLLEESTDGFPETLRGMFAIAIWDSRSRELMLVRDRVGIKPLYYARTSEFLIFGSEIKAILASGLVTPRIDRESLDDLLSLSFPLPPRTMIEGIREVRPGTCVRADKRTGDIRETQYWSRQFRPASDHRAISAAEAGEELTTLIDQRVYDHMISDVPVGAYLSGGLDSSVITGTMQRVTGDPPTTFSLSFEDRAHDESEYALQMSRALGGAHTSVECGADIADGFERMIWHTELPLQFPLALPLMRLAEAARGQGYSVVLTGEGADELFGGYDCFRADKMRRVLDRPGLRFLRPLIYEQLYKWHSLPDGTVEQMLQNQKTASRTAEAFGGHLPPWFDMWTTVGIDRSRLLGVDSRKVRPVAEPPQGFGTLLPDNYESLHPLDAGLALEQATRLPAWILLIGDRASMSASVEARVPLLDHTIVDFVNSLPPSLKMRGFREKALLRSVADSLIPRRIARRRKQPFFTPIRDWFFSPQAPDFVRDHLSKPSLERAGLFDPGLVQSYLERIRSVPDDHLIRHSLEWTLILVLGAQVLSRQLVDQEGLGASLRNA